MNKCKINKVNIEFNVEKILNDFTIVKFSTTQNYINYGAAFLDEINLECHTRSIMFDKGKSFYALFDKSEFKTIDLATKIQILEDGDMLVYEVIDNESRLNDVPVHLLAQLLVNSISAPKHRRLSFNNLTGKLLVFNPNYFSVSRTKDEEKILKIIGMEFRINSLLSIELNVRTFSSLLLKGKMDFTKKKIIKYPKYTFVHSTQTLKRVFKSDDIPFDSQYILKQTSKQGKGQKSIIPFLNFKSMADFKDSKIGMLDEILSKVESVLGDYLQLSFVNVPIANVIRYSNTHFFKSLNLKISLMDLCKEDDSEERLKIISEELINLSPNIQIVNKRQADQKIKLIHNRSFYEKYELDDPYKPSLDTQHLTLEDFNLDSKASVKAVIYELAIKSDVKREVISVVDWTRFNFSDEWVFGMKKDESFYFLKVATDGRMKFQKFEPNLFNQHEYDELCDIFNENIDVEFLVKDDVGNINFISKTDGFSIPEYETISQVLWNEAQPLKLSKAEAKDIVSELFTEGNGKKLATRIDSIEKWNKNSLLNCFDNRIDRKIFVTKVMHESGEIIKSYLRDKSRYEILDSQLDIHQYSLDEGYYYFVGVKGSGIQQQITRASLIRKISTYRDSRFIFDQLLPLMNVDFIKNGDLTVIPFPLKYLREWIKTMGQYNHINRAI